MAFPTITAVSESNATADTATFTISRPAGVAGRLTIVVLQTDGSPTLTWPSGYTVFKSTTLPISGFSLFLAYKKEDGSEGTTFSVTSSVAEKFAAIVYQISGAEDPTTQPPEASIAQDQASTANPDCPALTPTGGAKDYLWIAVAANDGEEADDDTWGNTSPTNYTPSPPRQKTSDIAGAASTNVSLETAERQLNAASENPGTFNNDVAHTYHSATIAIHPPGAPVTPVRVTASEANLDYNIPVRVTASEANLDYNIPARVTASEINLDYIGATRIVASEANLDYNVPTRITASEANLDYNIPARIVASEVNLDYAVPVRVSASEIILDFFVPVRIVAGKIVLDYSLPAPVRIVASETILDYLVSSFQTFGQIFLYVASQWENAQIFLEATMRAMDGEAKARLYDLTVDAPVAGTEISTASTSFVRVRGGNIKSLLVDGHEYRIQFGRTGTGMEFIGGRLVVRRS